MSIIKYGIIGASSNILAYLLYLFLTSSGVPPITSMTAIYCATIVATFFLNGKWAFTQSRLNKVHLFRYVATYGIGYILNFSLLKLIHYKLEFGHQVAQGISILLVAIFIFTLQKHWVFKSSQATVN